MFALRGRALLVYLSLVAIWGSTWLVIRVGVRDLPPLAFAGWRMGLACLLLAPFALRPGAPRPTRPEVFWVALNGLLQIGVSYAFVFTAAKWIESGLSALLFATFPIWAGVFAHISLPGEPLTRRTAAAFGLGLAGVALIQAPALQRAWHGQAGSVALGGGLMLGSAIVSAWANVQLKKRLGGVSPVWNVWAQTLVGSLFLLACALAFERAGDPVWNVRSIGALLYLAIFGTVLGFIGLFWLIPRVPVAVIGTIPLVDTLLAVLFGAWILDEALPGRVLAGGALILGGVLLVTARREPERSVLA